MSLGWVRGDHCLFEILKWCDSLLKLTILPVQNDLRIFYYASICQPSFIKIEQFTNFISIVFRCLSTNSWNMSNVKSNTPKKLYGSLHFDSRCRLCLKVCDRKHNINLFKSSNSSVLHTAEHLIGEQLYQDDFLPHLLCRPCARRLNNFNDFKKVILDSNKTLETEYRKKRCLEMSPSLLPAAKRSVNPDRSNDVRTRSRRELSFEPEKNEVNFIHTISGPVFHI